MNQTDKNRVVFVIVFVVVVLGTMVGWLFGRDPSLMAAVLVAAAGGVGVGEGSNIGKRATFKPEAIGHDE